MIKLSDIKVSEFELRSFELELRSFEDFFGISVIAN